MLVKLTDREIQQTNYNVKVNLSPRSGSLEENSISSRKPPTNLDNSVKIVKHRDEHCLIDEEAFETERIQPFCLANDRNNFKQCNQIGMLSSSELSNNSKAPLSSHRPFTNMC